VRAAGHIVAALGFGASAWKVKPQDQVIGWTTDQRERNLHLVVNNARFLILPWIRCKNLASRILALASRRLPDDWHARYDYRPVLLETFVEKPRFTGTCYKTANWRHLGDTQGRGKLDVLPAPRRQQRGSRLMALRDLRHIGSRSVRFLDDLPASARASRIFAESSSAYSTRCYLLPSRSPTRGTCPLMVSRTALIYVQWPTPPCRRLPIVEQGEG
jgi:hypothetical protein